LPIFPERKKQGNTKTELLRIAQPRAAVIPSWPARASGSRNLFFPFSDFGLLERPTSEEVPDTPAICLWRYQPA
jgi:hypothetical protein